MLAALVFAVAPAGAKTLGTKLPFSLEPIGMPNAIAIDQATGNVYVTDQATQTVKIFGAEGGSPTAGVPTEVGGSETPSGSFNFLAASEPVGVAVNESGVLYVADVGHKAVDKFKLEGGAYKYVCQFTGFENSGNGCLPNLLTLETIPAKPFTGPGGIAIDGAGNVYVSDFSGALYEFNAAGEDVRQAAIPSGEPSGVAVDSNGVVYVQDYQGPVYKLTLGITSEFEVALLDSEHARAIAVNPANNHVYVDHNNYVVEREPPEGPAPGEVIGEYRPSGLASEGIAVNGASGDVYFGNVITKRIEAIKFVKVPDVRLSCPATEITANEATLHGEINPEETSEAAYYFEYGPAPTFNATTSPTSVPPVNEFTSASATLTGLQPATEYRYRLVGTNSSGLLEPSEGYCTFTTLGVEPEVEAVEAIDVTTHSVVFRGFVNPHNSPTSFRFEYGATTGYGRSLPNIPIATTATPIEVQQAVGGLKPGSIYHFRIVASNAWGEAVGADQTFTTASAATPPAGAPVINTGPAVAIGPNSAVLTGTVFPEGTQTMYLFELGSSTAYGTQLFGGEAGREGGFLPVSVAAGNLQPGSVYHYRLVAVNAAGTSIGPDRTFTTTTLPQQILKPPTPSLVPIPVFPLVKNPIFKPPKKHHKHHPHKKPKRRRAHGGRAARPRHGR
jgi:streptogramin lyase